MRARMFATAVKPKDNFPWGKFMTGVVVVNAALFAVTIRETRQEQEELEAAQRQAHLSDLHEDMEAARTKNRM